MSKIKHFISRITPQGNLSTPNAIIVGAIILAVSHIGYAYITVGQNNSAPTTPFAGRVIDSTDYVEGNKDADVFVVEYSDPECPYCVQVHPTLKQIRAEYSDKVAFVYRHFPLVQIHDNAFDESRAIACAGKIGGSDGYYKYLDSLFDYKYNTRTTQLKNGQKETIAKEVGLDMSKFNSCMTNKETEAEVSNSLNDGVTAGVEGTPATFILVKNKKGYNVVSKIDGARPVEFIRSAVEQALEQ